MKRYTLINVFCIVVLALITVGFGLYLAPRLGDLLALKAIHWSILPQKEASFNSLFYEQRLMEHQYEAALAKDITETLEKITGKGTVYATVRAPLDFVQETTYPAPNSQINAVGVDVRQLFVTVLLDDDKITNHAGKILYHPHSKQNIGIYTQLVKTLVGFDARRGDKVEVQNLSFMSKKEEIFGIPRFVWAEGIAFILFSGLIIWIILGFLFPIMRQLVHEMQGKLSPHRYPLIKRVISLCQKYPEQSLSVIRGWLNMPFVRKNSRSYTFAERAGILVLALGPTLNRKILHNLSDAEAKYLARIVSKLGRFSPADVQEVLTRFMRDFYAPSYLKGTQKEAKEILVNSKPNGEELYTEINPLTSKTSSVAWHTICRLSDDKIKMLLRHTDKKVMATALAKEQSNIQMLFARNLPPLLWQELKNYFSDVTWDETLRARKIIIQTANELHLFG